MTTITVTTTSNNNNPRINQECRGKGQSQQEVVLVVVLFVGVGALLLSMIVVRMLFICCLMFVYWVVFLFVVVFFAIPQLWIHSAGRSSAHGRNKNKNITPSLLRRQCKRRICETWKRLSDSTDSNSNDITTATTTIKSTLWQLSTSLPGTRCNKHHDEENAPGKIRSAIWHAKVQSNKTAAPTTRPTN